MRIYKSMMICGLQQVETGDCPHLLFYGPPGSGKKTLIVALLKEIYGNGAERVHFSNAPSAVGLSMRLPISLVRMKWKWMLMLLLIAGQSRDKAMEDPGKCYLQKNTSRLAL